MGSCSGTEIDTIGIMHKFVPQVLPNPKTDDAKLKSDGVFVQGAAKFASHAYESAFKILP